jgi:hypothetical protein
LLTGGRLFSRGRLLANRFLAVLLPLVLRLVALERGLFAGRSRFDLGNRFPGRSCVLGRRRHDGRLGRLGLPVLLARLGLIGRLVVVGGCHLASGGLSSRSGFDLLLLIALLLARLQLLFIDSGSSLLRRRCFGWRLFSLLLLLITLPLARLLLFGGRSGLFGWRGFDLLLLLIVLPLARLLLGLRLLVGGCLLGLLLLVTLLARWLLALRGLLRLGGLGLFLLLGDPLLLCTGFG